MTWHGRWVAGIVGPVVFMSAAAFGVTLYDGYSSANQFVSELAAKGSDARPLLTVAFLIFGVCTLLLATRMRELWPSAIAALVALTASGVGIVTAGLFSCDLGCPTEGSRSFSQQMHDISGIVSFVGWALAALLAGWTFRRQLYGRLSLGLGAIQAAGMAWTAIAYMPRAPGDAVGVSQRVGLFSVAAWYFLTAWQLREQPTHVADSP